MRKSQKKANIKPSSLVPEHMLLRENGWWHPILILDVDGCLLDWREDFCRFVNRQFAAQGLKRRLDPNSLSIFMFGHDPRSGMTPREFGFMFDRFCEQTVGGFDNLKEIAGAIKAVQRIQDAGIHTIVMTDVPGPLDRMSTGQMHSSGNAQLLRRRQLLRLGVVKEPDDIKFVPGHEKAKLMADDTRAIPAAVEDRPSTAVAMAQEFARKCFLMDQPYNQGHDCEGLERCRNLAAAVPRILKFYDRLEAAGKLRPRTKRGETIVERKHRDDEKVA
jgi:hypothetical protein